MLTKPFLPKKYEHDILLDDIIVLATNESLCKEFDEMMWNNSKMSMMGELRHFLNLQMIQCTDENSCT